MKLSEIQVGTKIELELYDDNDIKIESPFISEFDWAEGDSIAYIAAPIAEGIYYPVHVGNAVTVYFTFNGEFYRFNVRIKEKTTKEKVPLLKVEMYGDIERIQRRQFFRFDCLVPIKYRVVYSIEYAVIDKVPFINTTTKDLSGGGLCIALDEKVEFDKIIECELTLPESGTLKFFGKVVRLSDFQVKGTIKYEIGVEFLKITNKDRENIIGYIFQEQRKLRKKGLI